MHEASFGEVSKIVASMWDGLDVDHKNVYKKKTEAAKKEYLKALAAYRASLVSKGAPTDSPDGSGMYPPPSFNQSIANSQHYQQQQQAPPQSYYGNQSQGGAPQHKKSPPAQQQTQQGSTMPPPNQQPPHLNQQQPGHSHAMMQQHHHLESQHSQQQQYGHGGMGHNPTYMNTMGDGQHGMANSPNIHPSGGGGGHGQMNPGSGVNPMVAEGQNHSHGRVHCVRNGCSNVASNPSEADMQGYDEGYCSSQCVVTHCRDVFTNWVSTNQSGNPNYGGGMKYTTSASSTVVGPDGLSYVT
ncbi:TOX high mobility group box family member 2 [Folsomia candida]|uniref:TOX high mobility group box family member 2 n=1 Tax=Folsomia candida TaxID=158441 RepID=A0A226F4N5_FOLCA|nr:TOX high mobility group box family member 2 [Folsomia candida]